MSRCAAEGEKALAAFEWEAGSTLWRFSLFEAPDRALLSVWPCYRDDTGQWRPCKRAYAPRGGFTMPLEVVPDLIRSLASISGETTSKHEG